MRDKAYRIRHRAQLLRSVRHAHGPRHLDAGAHEVTVVVLVRDGMYYLDSFFDHYRSLGARHFVFIDNGSSDGTVARIKREPGTVVVQSSLPRGLFENDFRRCAAETYCANDPFGPDAQSVQGAATSHGEDRQRLRLVQEDPDLMLYSGDAMTFTGVEELQKSGFLVPSARYTGFVRGAR